MAWDSPLPCWAGSHVHVIDYYIWKFLTYVWSDGAITLRPMVLYWDTGYMRMNWGILEHKHMNPFEIGFVSRVVSMICLALKSEWVVYALMTYLIVLPINKLILHDDTGTQHSLLLNLFRTMSEMAFQFCWLY